MTSIRDMVKDHAFLRTYIDYNAGNESPELYHLWAALSGVSAALGRKCYIEDGDDKIYPNVFTILIGPPAVRKSSAISALRSILGEATKVRFSPTDIAGQKQGLLSYLAEDHISDDDDDNTTRSNARKSVDLMDANAWLDEEVSIGSPLDRSSVFVCAGELVSFAGISSATLLAALGDLYDCNDSYEYKLKKSSIFVDKPAIQMLAATTPSQLPQIMPPEVINQGLLSRLIFVHSEQPSKRLARRVKGDPAMREYIAETLHNCFYDREGVVAESFEAMTIVDKLYTSNEASTRITDPRLQYYVNRRHAHLRKLTILLARSAGRQKIEAFDVNLAHRILSYTEELMPNAIGEYGTSAESRVRQQVVEYLSQQRTMLTFSELHEQLQHACPKRTTFHTILQDLVEGRKIVSVTNQYDESGMATVRYGVPGMLSDVGTRTRLLEELRKSMPTN